MERKRVIIVTLATFLNLALHDGNSIAAVQTPIQPESTNPGKTEIVTNKPFPAPTVSVLDRLLTPINADALARREKVFSENPHIKEAVDPELNKNRLNFLLFGYGETHEPPVTEHAFIGSYTMFSLNTKTHEYDLISFTHDIRSPEIERYKRKIGGEVPFAFKMGQAYGDGGFPLLREIMVNATGLYPDLSVYMPDVAVARLIDQVPQKIQVDSPRDFNVYPIYLGGKKYPGIRTFKEGVNELDGVGAIQFIKSVPVQDQGKDIEHNPRKARVIKALVSSFKNSLTDPVFWFRAKGFMEENARLGENEINRTTTIGYDFDPTIFTSSIGSLVTDLGLAQLQGAQIDSTFPTERSSTYIVDAAHGDGGVSWIKWDATYNPITKGDIEKGFYPDPATEVPIGADPYAEKLYEGYWGSVRSIIKQRLADSGK